MPDAVPLVTVGIPTYNRRDSLLRAVESVLGQSYQPLDIVICDNASSDGTREACEDLSSRHREIRYIRQEHNVGPTANFNRIFAAAMGPYFMWLGDDDWLDPDYVATCVAVLEADSSAVLVAGRPEYHRDAELVRHGVSMNLDHDRPEDRVASYFRLVEENGVFYGVARTEPLGRAMPLSNEMGGDWFLIARLAFLGKVLMLPTVAVHRAVGGATRNLREVARSAGLGRFQAAAPQVALAAFAARDIAWRSSVYRTLPTLSRAALAGRCAAIVSRRFLPGAVQKWVRLKVGARDAH